MIENVSVADAEAPAGSPSTTSRSTYGAGEIVCIYGLMGAGRTELLEALAGRHADRRRPSRCSAAGPRGT